MAEETIKSKLIIEIGDKSYEIAGGGGVPDPDSVGTEQIKDGAVEEQDLHDDVKDRMTITHDSTTGGLRIGGYAKPGDVPASNGQDAGYQEDEFNDDEEIGAGGGMDEE